MQLWSFFRIQTEGEIIILTGDFNLGPLYGDTIKTLIDSDPFISVY